MIRKEPLINGCVYHVMNKSIENYVLFRTDYDYARFLEEIKYYRFLSNKAKFSNHILSQEKGEKRVDILAYALMPTHFHLLIRQNTNNGISEFMNYLQNSYSHYFNSKHERKGPLWVGKFKNVLIKNNEQLLHVTRYIHLNPVKAKLVDSADKWKYSSYCEYATGRENICVFKDLVAMTPFEYINFLKDLCEDKVIEGIIPLLE